MRHRLVHNCMNVDLDKVWRVVENDLDALVGAIEAQGITVEPQDE